METIEDRIKIEYHRLVHKLNIIPTYLIVHPKFTEYLSAKYSIVPLGAYGDNNAKYMGMEVKRSLDLKEDDFLLSFSKYDL